jgi:RNA polymerase sigma-70 factor (ECF subfamily)
VSDRQAEEQALVTRAQGGDEEAFRELVVRYEQETFRVAYLVLRDTDDAKDAAQEAFIRAYRSMKTFKGDRPFRPWILRIATNQALTLAKRRRRWESSGLAPERAEGGGADAMVVDGERAEALMAALQRLREKDRVIVYLRYFLELSERELAEHLGCAQGTVKSRLHRSLSRLRETIASDFPQLLAEQD